MLQMQAAKDEGAGVRVTGNAGRSSSPAFTSVSSLGLSSPFSSRSSPSDGSGSRHTGGIARSFTTPVTPVIQQPIALFPRASASPTFSSQPASGNNDEMPSWASSPSPSSAIFVPTRQSAKYVYMYVYMYTSMYICPSVSLCLCLSLPLH